MMSLLDDFKENTAVFNGREGILDQGAFDRLIEKQGIDVARGYLKAVYEITQLLGEAIVVPYDQELDILETPARLYGKISNLHRALFKFAGDNGLSTQSFKPTNPDKTKVKGW